MAEYFEPASTVFLCQVPWDSNYDDVVDWHITLLRQKYFDSISKDEITVLGSSTYMPLGMSVCVDLPYEKARRYNYCIVTNNRQVEGDISYTLYYFITGADYNNPASTTLQLSLDVWTTRYPETHVDIGYVERSSCALVNEPLVHAVNKPLAWNRYCTMSDGVSSSDMYYTFHTDSISVQSLGDNPYIDFISVVSTVSLIDDPGTIDNPNLKTASGRAQDGVYSGCAVYMVKQENFYDFMHSISDYPWVSQCIISLTSIPSILVADDNLLERKLFGKSDFPIYEISGARNTRWSEAIPPGIGYEIDVAKLSDDSRYNEVTEPYKDLDKLNCYPYSVIELTFTMSGQSVFLKPECLGNNKVALRYICAAIQPYTSMAVFPESYGCFNAGTFDVAFYDKQSGSVGHKTLPYGELTNCALWLDDFPQWSIVNNSYITYMASTAHTRQYLYDSAVWTYNRSNNSANAVYSNSMLEANNQYQNAMIERNVAAAQSEWQNRQKLLDAGVSAADLLVSSTVNAGTRNYGAAASSLVRGGGEFASSYFDFVATKDMNNRNLQAMSSVATNNVTTAGSIAANNLALANYVNKGDYDIQVKGIDASYADAALTQPSQSGAMGGNGLRYSNDVFYNLEIRYKSISDDAIVRNGDYFLRFGYTINRYMNIPSRLVTNTYYSYWKIQQLNINDTYSNESEKDVIRGIFSKGVTVWKDPTKIAKILPRDNKPDMTRVAEYYV